MRRTKLDLTAAALWAIVVANDTLTVTGADALYQAASFTFTEDRTGRDCRARLEWAWPISSDLRDCTYLGIPGISLIYVDPHYRRQPSPGMREVSMPFRPKGCTTYVMKSDPTSAFIEDTSTPMPAFVALDLSKPGSLARLPELTGASYEVFLFVTNQTQLDACRKHLLEEAGRGGRRGLNVYGFAPKLRGSLKTLDCLVLEKCDLGNADGTFLGGVPHVEIIQCDNVQLDGIPGANVISKLVLDQSEIWDLRPLSRMRNLTFLEVVVRLGNYKEYWQNILSIRQLIGLRLEYPPIENIHIRGIEKLPSLQFLSLSGHLGADDLQRLAGLKKLRALEIAHVHKLESLPVMETLEILSISEAYDVKAIPAIMKMPRLMYVDLSETEVRWNRGVARPKSLKYMLLPEGGDAGGEKGGP